MKSKLQEVVTDDQEVFKYIGIQPMTPPSGTIFLLKNKYGLNTHIDLNINETSRKNHLIDNTTSVVFDAISIINLL